MTDPTIRDEGPSPVDHETAHKSNPRTTLIVVAGFVVTLVLLIALNWN